MLEEKEADQIKCSWFPTVALQSLQITSQPPSLVSVSFWVANFKNTHTVHRLGKSRLTYHRVFLMKRTATACVMAKANMCLLASGYKWLWGKDEHMAEVCVSSTVQMELLLYVQYHTLDWKYHAVIVQQISHLKSFSTSLHLYSWGEVPLVFFSILFTHLITKMPLTSIRWQHWDGSKIEDVSIKAHNEWMKY